MEVVEADRKGRHADTKKFNQELDYYIREMKLYGEHYDKAYRDMFEYYLKDNQASYAFPCKGQRKIAVFSV